MPATPLGATTEEYIRLFAAEGVGVTTEPLGGPLGKDGDCLLVLGMQRDNMSGGARACPAADECAAAAARILGCLETRVDGKWAVGFTKDLIPAEHCLFSHKPGQPGRLPYSISGSPGSALQWDVCDSLSRLRAVVPRRIVAGFKTYHDQIQSPSAVSYTAEAMAQLRQAGIERERDENRVLNKLLAYTGGIAAPSSAMDAPCGLRMSSVDAPPDVMGLQGYTTLSGQQVKPVSLFDAICSALPGKKVSQMRRLFIVGLPFEEDVLDTALCALLRNSATDVYIVIDAVSGASFGQELPYTTQAATLLARNGVKLTTESSVVFPRPGVSLLSLSAPKPRAPVEPGVVVPPGGSGSSHAAARDPTAPASAMREAASAKNCVAVAAIPLLFPPKEKLAAGPADGAHPVGPAGAAPRSNSKAAEVLRQLGGGGGGGSAAAGSLAERRAPEGCVRDLYITTYALELFTVGMAEGKLCDVLTGLENFGGKHRVPVKAARLGSCLMKWLNRDETRSSHWKWVTPAVTLRSPFPTGVAAMTLQVSSKVNPQLSAIYGDENFQIPVEEAMRLVGTRTFVTQSGALSHIRRILQRVASPALLSYLALTVRHSLKACLNVDGMLATELVRHIEKKVQDAEDDDTTTPDLLWYAEKVAEVTSDWKTVLLAGQQLQQEMDVMRKSLNDHTERAALDAALEYSISELASLGCARSEGYFITSAPDSKIRICKGKCCVFATACAPDFSHFAGKEQDSLRYFDGAKGVHTERRWRHDGKALLGSRLRQTFHTALSAFRQSGVTSVSLSPLGCRPQDLEAVPVHLRGDVVRETLRALFASLQRPWGFGQVFLQVLQEHFVMASEELASVGTAGGGCICNVVLHLKDAREVAYRLGVSSGLVGTDVGYLVCGDVFSVMLGQTGGCWENGLTQSAYSYQEDLANTSTYLLQHLGVSGDGLRSEAIAPHTATPPLSASIGPPLKPPKKR